MALKLSESPNIVVKEIDLSGVVPAVTSSTGALVGDFNWGPAEQPILVGNEAELSLAGYGLGRSIKVGEDGSYDLFKSPRAAAISRATSFET